MEKRNKPGPAQIGAIFKAQKNERTSKSQSILFYSTRFFLKKSQNAEENLKGDPLGKFFSEKKSRNADTKLKRDPLVSSGIVCYGANLFGSVPWANVGNLYL